MNKEMKDRLEKQPWLEPFIEDGDQTLAPAELRWAQAVEIAVDELARLGVEVHKRMKSSRGYETTALEVVAGKERS